MGNDSQLHAVQQNGSSDRGRHDGARTITAVPEQFHNMSRAGACRHIEKNNSFLHGTDGIVLAYSETLILADEVAISGLQWWMQATEES